MRPGPKIREKTIEDILERTERDGECCIWKGATHKQGYGMMRQNGVMRTVHSVVAELKYGRKPTKYGGDRATRTCNNNLCVNPDHIIIKDASEIHSGIFPKKRTLSMETVRAIREEYAKGEYGRGPRIARKYNISDNLVYAIANGRIYKERTDES